MFAKTKLYACLSVLVVAVAACSGHSSESWDAEHGVYRAADDSITMQLPNDVLWDRVDVAGMPDNVRFCFTNPQVDMAILLSKLDGDIHDENNWQQWSQDLSMQDTTTSDSIVNSSVRVDKAFGTDRVVFRYDVMKVNDLEQDTAYVTYSGVFTNSPRGPYMGCVVIPTFKMELDGAGETLLSIWDGLTIKSPAK